MQIAYALQSANIARIFATLGADPHSLSYFWILPPLMGIIVQPIVGTLSDKTWCRFGRRIPYLFVGAAAAVVVMCLLPNAGSLGMTVSTAMIFGLCALMFLDTSINMAMQPFKMLVGDMVNEKQKTLAYSIQSFLCNAGSLVGYVFPFFFTVLGISNVAPKGVVPDSVIYSFYIGAAILILCVIYTTAKVKEMPPAEYAEYHGLDKPLNEEKVNIMRLLRNAPSTFWTVGLVQFFCWAAFMYMWTYTNGTIAETCWQTTDVASEGYQAAGNWVGVLFAVHDLIVNFLDMVENHKMVVENSGLLTVSALKQLDCKGKKIVCILSGGNMDVITMSSVVQHGLIQRGRIFTVSVQLPDRPGELVRVADVIAKAQGNIIRLEHNQFVSINRNAAVELTITMEAFGNDHKESIIAALKKAGYTPKPEQPTAVYQ